MLVLITMVILSTEITKLKKKSNLITLTNLNSLTSYVAKLFGSNSTIK